MGIYTSIKLPQITDEKLDDRKERKQILNYLGLLDEKLRYMFQNIDIEENLSEDSKKYLFAQGDAILNVVKDTEKNFSLFRQDVDRIEMAVFAEDGQTSRLDITANAIRGEVAAVRTELDGKITANTASITHTASQIQSVVTSVSTLNGKVSDHTTKITQTADVINFMVSAKKDDDGAIASITLTTKMEDAMEDKIKSEIDLFADKINLNGYVTFSALTEEGKTEINGANITTGKVSADHIGLYGKMNVYQEYKDSEYISIGGYFGYMYGDDPLNGSTAGIGMTDYSKSGGVICHGSGSAIWYDDYGITIDSSDINFVGDYDFYLATNFYCGTEGVSALGKSNKPWAMLYADACSCCTSDERRKNSIGYDLTAYEGLFERLKPTQFKMNNGTSDRFHIGFISQDVESAMGEIGMDSRGFAGFIKSPVYEEDEKGREIEGGNVVDHRYGLRYEEFIALNTHMIQKLMARVSELENKLEALS